MKGVVFVFAAALGLACPGSVEVSAPTLKVTFDDTARGAVTRIRTAGGAELGSPNRACAESLFKIELFAVGCPTNQVAVDAQQAGRFSVRREGKGLVLRYEDVGRVVEAVECRAVPDAADGAVHWRLSATPRPGWAVESVTYPRLSLTKAIGTRAEDDSLIVGSAKGGVTRNPCGKAGAKAGFRRPGNLVAQFASYYDDAAGFYSAAEDSTGCVKSFLWANEADGLTFRWEHKTYETAAFALPYDVVTAGLEGRPADPLTWHDAADRYRAWAERQPWCAVRFADRTDVPAWLKDAPAMTRFTRDWLRSPDRIRAWMRDYWRKEFGNVPLVTAYWGWEKVGNWITPDYFPLHPSDEACWALFADMKALGAHAFPWPSGYHWTLTFDRRENGSFAWDDRERFGRIGLPHAVMNRDGTRYTRTPSWLRGGDTACMCGGDSWTRNWWNNDICRPLAKLGAEMIQVDQVVGAAYPACWSTSHGHTPGEGRWKSDLFREQLVTMRETMRREQPDAVVCYEEPNEQFNDVIGIQDYRDCECNAAEWASVFNYLYHDYVPCFQSNPRRGSRIWQAHEAADGQIPFLSPNTHDLAGEHDAVVNGDFEQTDSSASGFVGWDRLKGFKGQTWSGRAFVDREVRHDGGAALRLEVAKGERSAQVSQNIPFDGMFRAGRTYRLSAWLKAGPGGGDKAVRFLAMAGSSGVKGCDGRIAFPRPEEGWRHLSADFKAPKGAEYLRVMIHLDAPAQGWVDSVSVDEVLADGSLRRVRGTNRGAYDDFMKRWVGLYRGEGRPYLAYGRQIKPPRIACKTQPYVGRNWSGDRIPLERPSVFCNAYRAADGSEAVVYANATDRTQRFTSDWRGERKTLTLGPDELRLVRVGTATTSNTTK